MGRCAPPTLDRLREEKERGAGSVEYVGIIIAVAALVAVLIVAFQSSVASSLTDGIETAICKVTGGSGCGDRTASGDERTGTRPGDGREDSQAEGPDGSDKSRDDVGRDARDSRRDDARRDDPTKGPDPSDPGDGKAVGLGDPVTGESVPKPKPPAWKPVDEGAGEYNSDGNGFFDRLGKGDDLAVKAAAEAGAHAMSGTWPNASRNLLHFLGNSGEPLRQDVDQMLKDVPALNDAYTQSQDYFGDTAVSRAQELGVTGPTTFPISSEWMPFYVSKDLSADWFYATGGIQYSVVGEVTVSPTVVAGRGVDLRDDDLDGLS